MKVQRRYSICFTYAKRKPPPGVPAPKGGLLYLVLTAREASVKPLADVMRDHICCDGHDQRRYILHIFTSLPVKMGGVGRRISITYFQQKDTTKRPPCIHTTGVFLFNSYFPAASASKARPGPRRRVVPALFSVDGPQQGVSVQPSPGAGPRAVWTEHPAAAGRWIFCPARSAAPHTGRQLGVLLPQGQHGALIGEHPCLIAAKLGVGRVELPAQLLELGRPGRSGRAQGMTSPVRMPSPLPPPAVCAGRSDAPGQSPGKAVPADAAPASGGCSATPAAASSVAAPRYGLLPLFLRKGFSILALIYACSGSPAGRRSSWCRCSPPPRAWRQKHCRKRRREC